MSDMSSQVKPVYHRRRYLVDRALQLRLIFSLLIAVLLLSLLAGSSMYAGAVYLVEQQLYSPHLFFDSSGEFLLPLFVWLNLGLIAALSLGIFFLVRRYLASAAGSVARLEKHLAGISGGAMPLPIHFRRRDPLAPVATAFNKFAVGVRQRRIEARKKLLQLEAHLAIAENELKQGDNPTAIFEKVRVELASVRLTPDNKGEN